MLQSLRENLKGTVAIFIIIIFIVPLVLVGVDQLFVGSAGGNDIAEVNGEGVDRMSFQRAMALEKQRRQNQFNLEPDSPQLEDSVLQGPVLKNLVQRLALYQAAEDAGVGFSKDTLWSEVRQAEIFQTDGKFDQQKFSDWLRFQNFTTASFLADSSKNGVVFQMRQAVMASAFATPKDLSLIAGITQQKRTFYTITIPKKPSEDIELSEEEITEYYQQNSSRFMTKETVKVEYLELSLDKLADEVDLEEAKVREAYDLEVANFNADPKYKIAHILVEEKDDSESVVNTVSEKLAAGEDFGELAKTYSDDLGSKNKGGELGSLTEETLLKEFIEPVKALQPGGVSAPIKTDSGTHFVKLLDVENAEPPSYEERKDALTKSLARALAQDTYTEKLGELDKRTFGDGSLAEIGKELGLELKTSAPFSRSGGAGIARHSEVAKAAFEKEVLEESYNSRVIEIPGDSAVVLHLLEHKPAVVKELDVVRNEIVTTLKNQKAQDQLKAMAETLQADIESGKSAEALAQENELEYKLHEEAKRTDFEIQFEALQKVFSLPRPSDAQPTIVDGVALRSGGYVIVGLQGVAEGQLSDLGEEERSAFETQLEQQLSQSELVSYENSIIEKAKIDMPEF